MKAKAWKSVGRWLAMRRPLGRLIVLALSATMLTVSCDSTQEGEKKIGIDQVPAEVKTAILKEVGDGRLVDIGVLTQEEKKAEVVKHFETVPLGN